MKKSKPLLSLLVLFITAIFLLHCGEEKSKTDQSKPSIKAPRNGKSKKASKTTTTKEAAESTGGAEGGYKKFADTDDESAETDDESREHTEAKKPSPKPEYKRRATPSTSGLKAGFVDDNKQFNYFIAYLNKFRRKVQAFEMNISERIKISVTDRQGKSLPNCEIEIKNQSDNPVYSAKTYADGTVLFFPSDLKGDRSRSFSATARYEGSTKRFTIKRYNKREVKVRFKLKRGRMKRVPLDIVFVMDTTGSMGEEIRKLKNTIDLIHLNVSSFSSKPDVRFGMVLYKDKNDSYVTKVIPLTSDLDSFKQDLDRVEASGGGDGPEDLQSALKDTLQSIHWRENGIKLGFIITDATAHLDYGQSYTYVKACRNAREQGIKLFSIGTGGLGTNGEYILRQIAQYTYANYIFLHYGEKGESSGGRAGAVSHHTGANYQVSKLEALIIRIAKKELSYLTNQPLEEEDEYWIAQRKGSQNRQDILKELFDKAVGQLLDYSTLNLKKNTAIAVLPIAAKTETIKPDAEYLVEQLTMSVSGKKEFKLVDRNQLEKVLGEMKLQSSALFDEKKSVKLGKLVGAKALVIGNLYLHRGKNLELFIKLVRVKTAEILSVSKIQISGDLR